MSVTAIAPPFVHTKLCDTLLMGYAVQNTLDDFPHADAVLVGDITGRFNLYRAKSTVACDCGQMALDQVTNSLRLARKSVVSWAEKHPAEELHYRTLTHRVDQLTARRDAIRSAASA